MELNRFVQPADGVVLGPKRKELRSASARPASEVAMQKAADAQLRKASRAISFALESAREAVSRGSIETALGLQSKSAIAKSVSPLASALEDELKKILPKVLLMGLKEGGQTGVKLLNKTLKTLGDFRAAAPKKTGKYTSMSFDAKNPKVIEWAEEHAAEMISNITDTTRRKIAEAVVAALEQDLPLPEAYDRIVQAVGDDVRGMNIARTELMSAANEGQRQAWGQAVEKGFLAGTESRVSIATLGACAFCEAMDGQTAPLGEPYEPIDVAGTELEPGMGPPYHSQCRCTEGLQP